MAESVTFWLDNKSSSGTKVAQLGRQTLVNYRDRYYVVEDGAALKKAGRPLRYSPSSLPTLWKKALRGTAPSIDATVPVESATPRKSADSRRASVRKENKEESIMPEKQQVEVSPSVEPSTTPSVKPKAVRKPAGKPAAQALVSADCPYCSQRHEIPIEKGRSGRPFFQTCSKCRTDFAVRFVQVTLYQSQVAGFK